MAGSLLHLEIELSGERVGGEVDKSLILLVYDYNALGFGLALGWLEY
jgi:hypothetical protein